MYIEKYEERIRIINQEIAKLQPHCDGTHDCPNGVFCGSINFSACGRIQQLKSAKIQEGRELAILKKAKSNREALDKENKRLADIEEERLLQIQLENQRKQDEIKREESARLKLAIIPEITPALVATSSLLPLGIIGLFLYSRTARK
jgi:hypothetical protein